MCFDTWKGSGFTLCLERVELWSSQEASHSSGSWCGLLFMFKGAAPLYAKCMQVEYAIS